MPVVTGSSSDKSSMSKVSPSSPSAGRTLGLAIETADNAGDGGTFVGEKAVGGEESIFGDNLKDAENWAGESFGDLMALFVFLEYLR